MRLSYPRKVLHVTHSILLEHTLLFDLIVLAWNNLVITNLKYRFCNKNDKIDWLRVIKIILKALKEYFLVGWMK